MPHQRDEHAGRLDRGCNISSAPHQCAATGKRDRGWVISVSASAHRWAGGWSGRAGPSVGPAAAGAGHRPPVRGAQRCQVLSGYKHAHTPSSLSYSNACQSASVGCSRTAAPAVATPARTVKTQPPPAVSMICAPRQQRDDPPSLIHQHVNSWRRPSARHAAGAGPKR